MTKRTKKRLATDTLRLPVWKTTYLVTILSNEQISSDADLRAVMEECDTGEYIGDVEKRNEKTLDPKSVRRQLIKMGNDGCFFDKDSDDDA